MAGKLSKIGTMLGMGSRARSRKAAAVDVSKSAGTKIPRVLFNTFGGGGIPILESAFSKWEDSRNKLADAKIRKHGVDQRYHKDQSVDKSATEMVAEARKSRDDQHTQVQATKAHQQRVDAQASASADQGSSQIKLLSSIQHELVAIKGVLRIGGKKVGSDDRDSSGGIFGSIEQKLLGVVKKKMAGGLTKVAEKYAGKRLGGLAGRAAKLLGKDAVGDLAGGVTGDVAGSVTGGIAGDVVATGAGGATAAAGGGLAAAATTAAISAAAVGAAAAGGYMVGHEIHKHLLAGTKVDNSIGHGISRVLAFFGNQDAKDALKSENKYDTMVASHKTTVPTIKNPVSPIAKAVAALNPIGSVHADDMPLPGNHVAAATSASALAAPIAAELSTAKNKKVAPLDRIVAYMSSLFDLASDNQKGLYVRVADNALDNPPAAAPAPRAATITSAGPSTIGSAASSVGMGGSSTSSPSYVAPAQRSTTMAQSGAATNSGWHPGHATGKLHFDVAAGQPGSETSGSIGAGPKSYGKVDGFNIDQMWDRMSGTIASGESGKAGYDAHHGGTIPGLTNMTIGQVKKMKGAMGKYQLLPGTTLGMAARNVGLSDSDLFNPANQEAMGKYLFAHRVKIGAKGGAAGIQKQLALEWASLPKNATGAGAYDGDAAGNMAAGGSARGQALASIISGSSSPGTVSGAPASTADSIDSATQDVAKNSSDNSPSVIVAPSSGGSSTPRQSSAGTGSGLAGPMVTRNSDSSVQAITQNFIAGSSAMG